MDVGALNYVVFMPDLNITVIKWSCQVSCTVMLSGKDLETKPQFQEHRLSPGAGSSLWGPQI